MSSKFVPEMTLRRGNKWLHRWLGLLLGWLSFLIFFTGTVSFYRTELSLWSKPEAHVTYQKESGITHALNYLDQHTKGAESWTIKLPNNRDSGLLVQWSMPGEGKGHGPKEKQGEHQNQGKNQKQGENQSQGKNQKQGENQKHKQKKRRNEVRIDPVTGDKLAVRESELFNTLYRMHYELYGLPRETGRLIVGLTTLAMFIAIISGVIIHKRFFKDFFTFQPKKRMRSWLDLHIITSVLALPFHIVLTYSGLMLFMYMLMPWGVNIGLNGDQFAMREVGGGKFGHSEYVLPETNTLRMNTDLILADALTDLIDQGNTQQQWSDSVTSIVLTKPQSAHPDITVWEQGANTLLNQGRVDRWHFSGKTGELTKIERSKVPESFAVQLYNTMVALHFQFYAQPLQRALFFIAGLFGTLMIATGLHIWLRKRGINSKTSTSKRIGLTAVKALNVGFLVGLPTAIAFAMWLNRTLPLEMLNRSDTEVNGLMIFWMLTFIWGLVRPYKKALIELGAIFSLLLLALFVYNLAFVYPSVGLQGQGWLGAPFGMQMIDISILFISLASAFFVYRSYQEQSHRGTVAKEKEEALEESLC